MPKGPTISLLMAVKDQKQYISDAIESVINQTNGDWELIIVDDGSVDGTREAFKTITDPRVHTYRLSNSMGKGRCLNEALARASGQFLFELDGDDWLDPSAVDTLVGLAHNWPDDTAFVYGNVKVFNQTSNGPRFVSVHKGKEYEDKYDFLINCDFFAPRLWKKSAVDKVGGWSTTGQKEVKLREAHDLAIKLMKEQKGAYQNFTVYNYRKHSESLTSKFNRRYAWSTKKESIIAALELWKSPYRPYFDDFMHLIFLKPEETPPTPKPSASKPPTEPPAKVEETPSPSDKNTARNQGRHDRRYGYNPWDRNEPERRKPEHQSRAANPVLIDLTAEKEAPRPQAGSLPKLSDSRDYDEQRVSSETPTTPEPDASPRLRRGETAKAAPLRLSEFFPGYTFRPEPAEPTTRPQPVNWLRGRRSGSQGQTGRRPIVQDQTSKRSTSQDQTERRSANQDQAPAQNPFFQNRNEPKRINADWQRELGSVPIAFYPVSSTGEGDEPSIHSQHAALLAKHLAESLGGVPLPLSQSLRESGDGGSGATYLDAPEDIRAQALADVSTLISSGCQLIVVVPGLNTSKSVQVLKSALNRDSLGLPVLVINETEILSALGVPKELVEDWPRLSAQYLGQGQSLDDESGGQMERYHKSLTERVRTEIKLAFKRTEIRHD